MANKEEVIFKVKAELQGFKKSMEDLKKVAKDSSKNIEKAMSMDLTDEGSKAGKSFAKGMNKELKSVTNALKNELKIMSDKTYTIKVKLDSSSVDRIKRDLSNIEIRVSASASGRASSSMNNNANAPNAANTMSSIANTAALTRLASEVNKAARLIGSKVPKVYDSKVKVDTDNAKVKVDTDNIPEIELKSPQIDPIDINVNIPDIPDVNIDPVDVNLTPATDALDQINVITNNISNTLNGVIAGLNTASKNLSGASGTLLNVQSSNIKVDAQDLKDAINTLNTAFSDIKDASEHTKDAASTIDTASTTMSQASQDMINACNIISTALGMLNQAFSNIVTVTGNINNLISALNNANINVSMPQNIPSIEVDVPESIDVNMNPTADALDSICEAINTASNNLTDAAGKIVNASKSISDASNSIMTLSNSSIDVNFTPAIDALDRINVISGNIADRLSATTDGIEYAGTLIYDASNALRDGSSNITSISNGIITASSNLDVASGNIDNASGNMKKSADAINEASDTLAGSTDDINTSIKKIGPEIKKIGKAINDSVKDVRKAIENAFKDSIKQLKQGIEGAFKKSTSAMSQDTSKTLGKVPKTVKREIIQGFDSAGKNIKSVLKEAFSDGARAIADAIRRAGDDFTPPTSPKDPNNGPKVPPTPTKPTAPPRKPEDPKPPTSDADYRKEVQRQLQYNDKYGILTQLKTPSEQGINLPKPFDLKDYYTISEKVQSVFKEIPEVIEGSIDDIENVGNEIESEGKKIVKKIMHTFQDIKVVLDDASQEFESNKIDLDIFDNIDSIDQARAAIERIESTVASLNEQIDKIMAATSKYKSINMHSLFGEDNPNIMQQSWDLAKELTDDKKIYGRKQENGKYISRFINPQVFKQNQQVLKELRTAYRTLTEEVSKYQDKIDEIYSAEYRLESIAEGKSSLAELAQQARIEYDSLLESVSRVHDEMSRVEREMEQVEATLGGADATQSSSVFNQYTNAMDNLQQEANELEAELEGLWRKLDEAELIVGNNPFDELCMDMEEANDSVSQLRMNIQLLANEKGIFGKLKDAFKNIFSTKKKETDGDSKDLADRIREQKIRDYINSLKEAEKAARDAENSLNGLDDAMDDAGDSSARLRMNLGSLAENQGGAFSKLKNTFSSIGNSINKSLSSVLNLIGDELVKLGNRIANLGIKLLNPINAFKVLKRTIDSVVLSASIKLWGAMENAINKSIQLIHKASDALKSFAVKTVEVTKSAISSAISAIKTFIGNTINAIKQFVRNTINATKQAINTTVNAIKTFARNTASAIKSFINSSFNAIKQAIHSTVNAIKTFVPTAINATKSFASGLWNRIVSLFNSTKQIITISKRIFDAAVKAAHNAINSIVKNAHKSISTIIQAIQKSFSMMQQAAHKAVVTIIQAPRKIASAVKTLITDVASAVRALVNDIGNGIKSFAHSAVNAIKTFTSDVYNAMRAFIPRAADIVKSVASKTTNTIKQAFDAIKTFVNSTINAIKTFASTAWNKLVSGFNAVKQAIQNAISAIKSFAHSTADAVKSFASTSWSKIVSGFNAIREAVYKTGSAIKNAFINVKNFIKTVPGAIDSGIISIGHAISKLGFKIKTFANDITGHMKKVADSIKNTLISAVSPINNAFVSLHTTIKNMFESIKNTIVSTVSSVKNGFTTMVSSVKNAFVSLGSSVKNTFTSIGSSVKNAFGSLKSHVKNSFAPIGSSVKNAFSIISSSAKKGLNDSIDSLKEFGQSAKSVTKSVASSSFDGAVNGFNKTKQAAQNAATGIAGAMNNIKGSAILNSLKGAMSRIGDAISRLTPKFKSFAQSVVSTAKTVTPRIWNGAVSGFNIVKQAAQNAATAVKGAMGKLANSIRSGAINSAVNNVTSSMSKLVSKIKGLSNNIPSSVKKIGSGIKSAFSGVVGVASSAMSKFGSIIGKLFNKLKDVSGKSKEASSGIKGFGNAAKGASSKVGKLTGSISGLLSKLGLFFGFYELFNLFKEGTKDAMKYEASIINLQMTYGDFAQELIDFANKQAVAFGISKKQVAEYGNIFSVIMRDANRALNPSAPASAISKQTVTMSQELIKSAGIIAGALGYETETVLEGLRSGILGSSEAVDQYGLNLKIANLEQSNTFKRVADGKKSWNDLTTAQQQYIIAQEIINQTTAKFGNLLDKNGNIMKTTASLHAQFLAQWQNTKLAIGNLGKVIWTAVVGPLTKVLAVMEMIFNYAAGALTAILESLGIHVDLAADLGGSKELENNLGGLDDTATDTSDAIDGVGDSAQDTAKDTEDAAKKIKRALAGFDQINVLSLGDDEEDSNLDDKIPDLGTWESPAFTGDYGVDIPKFTADTSGLKELSNNLKGILDELMTPFRAAWDILGNRWKSAWEDLKVSFKNFCESLSSFLASVWRNGGQEFVRHMAEIGLAVGIAAMEIGGTILDSLAKLWKHLDPDTNMNTKGFLDSLNLTAYSLRNFIINLSERFDSLMNNGGQEVLNALGDCFMNLGEAASHCVRVVIAAIDRMLKHIDPANNEITRGMLEMWENAFLAIGDAALEFSYFVLSVFANGGEDITNALGDLGVQILSTLGSLTTDVAEAFGNLFKHLDPTYNENTKDALESIKNFIDSIRNFVKMLGETFSTFMDNGGQEFLNGIGDIVMILIDLVATAGGGIIDVITGFINSFAGQALIKGAAKALAWFSDKLAGLKAIIEPLKDAFQDVVDFIVGIFEGDGEKVGRAFVSFIKNALKVGVELGKFMSEIGEALILGLIEGIKALPGLLWEAAKFLFDVLVGAVKELFGIHSPSTVMAEFGGYIIEGLAEGLTNTLSSIGDAIKKVYDFIIESFNGICEDIKGVFDKVKDIEIPSPKVIWDEAKRKVEDAVDKVKETVEKFKADLPKPSVVWDSIKTTAERTISNVKDSVERFKASLPKPTLNWNDLKTTLTDTLNKLKDTISRFKWELPKPKLPSFKVSGGKAPWGFMGQGSLPSISVKWNAQGGIMNSPTIFGMTGNTLLGGGEAGAEAILPLDELWNRLDNSFQQQNQALSRAIASSNNGSNRPVNVVLKVNDIEMGKVVVNSLKSLSNHSGGSLDLPFNK